MYYISSDLPIREESTDSFRYLSHHGIKGQKWGIRRFQNKDGSLTDEGKRQQYYRNRVKRELKYVDDKNAIVSTLSKKEQKMLGMSSKDTKWIDDDKRIETVSNIAKTFIQKHGNIPVSMLEIWDNGTDVGEITIATNPKYRGTGVTSKNIEEAVRWFNSNKNTKLKDLQWNNLKENPKSGAIAEKHGFGELETDDRWEYRIMRKK